MRSKFFEHLLYLTFKKPISPSTTSQSILAFVLNTDNDVFCAFSLLIPNK